MLLWVLLPYFCLAMLLLLLAGVPAAVFQHLQNQQHN
jgi:hypothetical protein